VALADDPAGRLAHRRKRLDQDVVEVLAVVEALAELGGLALQGVIGEFAVLVFEGVDVGDDALQRLDLLAFTCAQDAIENAHASVDAIGALIRRFGGARGGPRPIAAGSPVWFASAQFGYAGPSVG
jgi:hypothetical protein